MAYTKYSLTPANNNAAPPDGAPEGMLPSAVNDTMRDMMAQIRDVGDGIRGGTYTMTAPVITGGSITGVALSGNTLTNPVITGGSINNTPIGASTANTGAFTTLGATGVATFSAGTVSAPAITTTGDTNTGIYFPAADTIAFTEGGVESMRIDASGNVGIGTTGGIYKLDVVGAGAQSIRVASSNGDLATLRMLSSGNNEWSIASDTVMRFRKDATEYMRIDSSGNVGIGTSSPGSRLEISAANPFFTIYNTNTGDNGITWESDAAGGQSRASLFLNYSSAELRMTAGVGGNSYFQTFYTNGSERMRIDSSGNLLVGTTTNGGSDKAIFAYTDASTNGVGIRETSDASGTTFLSFRASNSGLCGRVTRVGTTNAVAYNTSSDYRLKENILPMTGALAKVALLKPCTYTWKSNGVNGQGFIAHELQEVVPDCVVGEKDAVDSAGNIQPQGIDTSFLVATLTAAIQELKATVDAQAAQIAALESK